MTEKVSKTEEVKKVFDFIKERDRFSIFYHIDGDGITSAVLLTAALKNFGKEVVFYRPTNYEDFENGIGMSEVTENIIICDLDGHQMQRNFGQFNGRNVCLIDHHEIVNAENFIYINPKMWGDLTYTPCALLIYRLFEDKIKDLDWIAMIGWISDAGAKDDKSFGIKTLEKYGMERGKHEFFFDNDFGRAAEMTNNMIIEYGREGADEVVGMLLSSNSVKDFMENERLKSASNKVDRNLKYLADDFDKRSECVEDLIYFFEMPSSKKRYSPALSTMLGLNKYKNNVIVIMTRIKGDVMKISMRATGLSIRLPDILRAIFKQIKGSGGGHDQASGAEIRPEDKEKFKVLFAEEVKKQLGGS
jgi:single-stranded DNA-specific DHH superfamily exonuclease